MSKGFILITILMFFVLLAGLVAVYLFISTTEMRQAGNVLLDAKALALAEAGLQRAIREIRDDVLTTTQTGTADLRGDDTSLSISIGTANNMRYIDSAVATINANSDQAILRTFDSNYTNTRIKSIELHARASRGTSGNANPTMQVSYTTDGATYKVAITQILTSTTLTDFSANITGTLTWQTIISPNFRLRVMRSAGTRDINLDSVYLRITYEIDTNTEAWSTGSYTTFPITLGDGTIDSITITAEQGKVHLNSASQSLLRYLMVERGIPTATANTLATNIIDYRTLKYFDSVQELQQVKGMTIAYYNLIKDFVTVYSFINSYVARPAGYRAPININTASREVLEAIYDPMVDLGNLGPTDPASLARDIITQRTTIPFTCFYSSNAGVTSDFYDFVNSRSYLTAAERNRVLDNADASSLIPVSGFAGYSCQTTEFSYGTNSFSIDSVGTISGISRHLKMVIKDDGKQYLDTYSGDTLLTKYWQEIP